jgi:hypothetical protein
LCVCVCIYQQLWCDNELVWVDNLIFQPLRFAGLAGRRSQYVCGWCNLSS